MEQVKIYKQIVEKTTCIYDFLVLESCHEFGKLKGDTGILLEIYLMTCSVQYVFLSSYFSLLSSLKVEE